MRLLTTLLLAASLLLSACAEEQTTASGTAVPEGEGHGIKIAFHNHWKGKPLKLNEIYTTPDEHRITFETVKFIASSVIGYTTDDKEYLIPDCYQIVYADKNEGVTTFDAGEIPKGEYTGFSFFIGLPKQTNHLDPVKDLGEDHPLFDPQMHWSWNPDAGFKFMSVLGKVDITAPLNDGKLKTAMEYDIAEDSRLTEIKVLQDQKLTVDDSNVGKSTTFEIDVEWSKFFAGLDMQEDYLSHSTGSGAALADRVVDNWPGMFSSRKQ